MINNRILVPNQRRDLLRIQSTTGVDDLVCPRRDREVALRQGLVEAATLPQTSRKHGVGGMRVSRGEWRVERREAWCEESKRGDESKWGVDVYDGSRGTRQRPQRNLYRRGVIGRQCRVGDGGRCDLHSCESCCITTDLHRINTCENGAHSNDPSTSRRPMLMIMRGKEVLSGDLVAYSRPLQPYGTGPGPGPGPSAEIASSTKTRWNDNSERQVYQ